MSRPMIGNPGNEARFMRAGEELRGHIAFRPAGATTRETGNHALL